MRTDFIQSAFNYFFFVLRAAIAIKVALIAAMRAAAVPASPVNGEFSENV